jgi:hypothetical protein
MPISDTAIVKKADNPFSEEQTELFIKSQKGAFSRIALSTAQVKLNALEA